MDAWEQRQAMLKEALTILDRMDKQQMILKEQVEAANRAMLTIGQQIPLLKHQIDWLRGQEPR